MDVSATAPSLADGSTATLIGRTQVYSSPRPDASRTWISPSDCPAFTFRSCEDEEWLEISYSGGTRYIPRAAISTGVAPTPTPGGSSGDGGYDPAPGPDYGSGGSASSQLPAVNLGQGSGEGVTMTVEINGKKTQVLLSIQNFTYDYDQPETVRVITGFNLRKGPNAAFGTYQKARRGMLLTIICLLYTSRCV